MLMVIFCCLSSCAIEDFFRVDINKKCILCKTENNSINHVVNVCKELEKERNDLINQINKFDKNTKNKIILEVIEYFYYNKTDSYNKDEIKLDNKGIKLIKNFVKKIYVKLIML